MSGEIFATPAGIFMWRSDVLWTQRDGEWMPYAPETSETVRKSASPSDLKPEALNANSLPIPD